MSRLVYNKEAVQLWKVYPEDNEPSRPSSERELHANGGQSQGSII